MNLSKDVVLDTDFLCVDREFFYFLLSCLITQKNMWRMTYEQIELAQESADNAVSDGIKMLKGVDFTPKSDILRRRIMIKLSEEYTKDHFDTRK